MSHHLLPPRLPEGPPLAGDDIGPESCDRLYDLPGPDIASAQRRSPSVVEFGGAMVLEYNVPDSSSPGFQPGTAPDEEKKPALGSTGERAPLPILEF